MIHELWGRLKAIVQTNFAMQEGQRSVAANHTKVAAPRKRPHAAKAMKKRPPEANEKKAAVRRPSVPVNPATAPYSFQACPVVMIQLDAPRLTEFPHSS